LVVESTKTARHFIKDYNLIHAYKEIRYDQDDRRRVHCFYYLDLVKTNLSKLEVDEEFRSVKPLSMYKNGKNTAQVSELGLEIAKFLNVGLLNNIFETNTYHPAKNNSS
jgi:hypothetical protein